MMSKLISLCATGSPKRGPSFWVGCRARDEEQIEERRASAEPPRIYSNPPTQISNRSLTSRPASYNLLNFWKSNPLLTNMSEKGGLGVGVIRSECTSDETWDKLTNVSLSTKDGGSKLCKWGLQASRLLPLWLALYGFVCPWWMEAPTVRVCRNYKHHFYLLQAKYCLLNIHTFTFY